MSKFYAILVAVVITAAAYCESPGKISFQAVIRNSQQILVSNQTIGVRISILQGSINGAPVYVEQQSPVSNNNGKLSLEIGTGQVQTGVFSAIDWSKGNYFLKTEFDPTGGVDYSITGTNEFLTVPYVFFADKADTISSLQTETQRAITAETQLQSKIDDLQKELSNFEIQLQSYIK